MRLIDSNELKEKLAELKRNNLTPSWCVALNLIDNAPTVEAKTTADCIIAYGDGYETARRLSERPQGEWKHDEKYLDVKCSICNSYALERGDYPELSKFCPHCGAEMKNNY